ncbi:MAG: hypothetical protein AAB439_03330 [Patescibacteria group bacterium]
MSVISAHEKPRVGDPTFTTIQASLWIAVIGAICVGAAFKMIDS